MQANANDILEYLQDHDTEYDEEQMPVIPGRANQVPDGDYVAVIYEAELATAKEAPLLRWRLIVAMGPQRGQLLERANFMSSRQNLGFLKRDLHTAGLVLPRLSDLPKYIDELRGRAVNCSVRRKVDDKGVDRCNVYLNGVAGMPDNDVKALLALADGDDGSSTGGAGAGVGGGSNGRGHEPLQF